MAKRILAPIDLAHESSWKRALPEAFRLASLDDGEVTVMTVVPDLAAGLDWRYAIRGEMKGSEAYDLRRIVEDAEKRLEQIVEEHAPEGGEVDVVARTGTVYEEILTVAEEIGADQIVLQAQRPSLSEYLIGPNAARVVRHAKCTVTVLRE